MIHRWASRLPRINLGICNFRERLFESSENGLFGLRTRAEQFDAAAFCGGTSANGCEVARGKANDTHDKVAKSAVIGDDLKLNTSGLLEVEQLTEDIRDCVRDEELRLESLSVRNLDEIAHCSANS